MIVFGWLYWLAFQTVSLILAAIGAVAILPLAALHLWKIRPGRSRYYPNRSVAAWPALEAGCAGFIAGAALGAAATLPFLFACAPILIAALIGAAAGTFGVWNNEEDGVTGSEAYAQAHAKRPAWLNTYLWSAWRNAVDNLRFAPGAFFVIDRAKLAVRAGSSVTTVSHGWRQCLIVHPKWLPIAFRFGWLLRPDAATGDYAWPIAGPE